MNGCPPRRPPSTRLLVTFAAGVALLAGCRRADAPASSPATASAAAHDPAAHAEEIAAWRARRDQGLRAPEGWTTLVGLSWLRPGENRVGSAPTADVVLPADRAAPEVGFIDFDEAAGRASFRSLRGASPRVVLDGQPVGDRPVDLLPDTAEGGPTRLGLGSLTFFLIERGGRVGVRVRDSESEVRRRFPGMDYFPVDPSWRVVARLEAATPGGPIPDRIRMPNVLGMLEEVPSPGAVVFTREGRTHRVTPIFEPGDPRYFYVFGDTTNGTETYGAGRFLYSEPASADGVVIVDFNRSYNPPCVFTAYATCQIPPPQNKLDLAIRAGERRYLGPTAGLPEDH